MAAGLTLMTCRKAQVQSHALREKAGVEALMAKRRIKNIRVGRCSVSIHRDTEWDEFVVTTKGPAKRFNGTYHTTTRATRVAPRPRRFICAQRPGDRELRL